MPDESTFSLKRLLLGKPIPSSMAHHERLSRVTGLAVLSSDALSSVAYATDFILATLVVAGVGAFSHAIPISLVIAALLAIVAFSYRQTIHAYPTGGGAYIVAKENIGDNAGLIAAASLLVDYTLTVSVSISAGILAVTSAFPALDVFRVEMCLACLAILMLGNLRGIRESGNIFAVPTYFFRLQHHGAAARGALQIRDRWNRAGAGHPAAWRRPLEAHDLSAADGVRQWRMRDDWRRGGIERCPRIPAAGSERIGHACHDGRAGDGHVRRHHCSRARVSRDADRRRIGRVAAGPRDFWRCGIIYYVIQAATMLILVLAANTAYADFPRLASIVARDRYLPRQLMNLGDRLAFSIGIVLLSVFAAVLIIGFHGDTQRLLPLYMIGVFVSFTLSQAGMVIHWRNAKTPGWKTSAFVNGFGAIVTSVVLV